IISAASDYRAAAQRILPPFLFHYMDGGAYSEYTLRRNVEDLSEVALRQRILKNMSVFSLETPLSNGTLSTPVALASVGVS
uniref:alpha-hydroxy-acid oxidizing protein n=1 Tax=Serratia marcescens TaxID=615 RepID=UPI001F0719B9